MVNILKRSYEDKLQKFLREEDKIFYDIRDLVTVLSVVEKKDLGSYEYDRLQSFLVPYRVLTNSYRPPNSIEEALCKNNPTRLQALCLIQADKKDFNKFLKQIGYHNKKIQLANWDDANFNPSEVKYKASDYSSIVNRAGKLLKRYKAATKKLGTQGSDEIVDANAHLKKESSTIIKSIGNKNDSLTEALTKLMKFRSPKTLVSSDHYLASFCDKIDKICRTARKEGKLNDADGCNEVKNDIYKLFQRNSSGNYVNIDLHAVMLEKYPEGNYGDKKIPSKIAAVFKLITSNIEPILNRSITEFNLKESLTGYNKLFDQSDYLSAESEVEEEKRQQVAHSRASPKEAAQGRHLRSSELRLNIGSSSASEEESSYENRHEIDSGAGVNKPTYRK